MELSPSTVKYLGLTLVLRSDGAFCFPKHSRAPVDCNHFQQTVSIASSNFVLTSKW